MQDGAEHEREKMVCRKSRNKGQERTEKWMKQAYLVMDTTSDDPSTVIVSFMLLVVLDVPVLVFPVPALVLDVPEVPVSVFPVPTLEFDVAEEPVSVFPVPTLLVVF